MYFATGRLGLLEEVVISHAHITPLWPPTGVALAGLLLLGVRIWPGIALGAASVVASFGPPAPSTLAFSAGNTAAALGAYALLRRVGFRIELDRLRDGLALVFLGAFAGTLISSGVGAGTLLLDGALPANGFWEAWSAWWTGDAMGVLVVTPLLLSLHAARRSGGLEPAAWAEPAALLAATAAVTAASTRTSLDLVFLVFPLLVWAVLRTRLVGAAPCVLALSVFSVVAARGRHGPFAHRDIVATMVGLQALNGAAALTTLLLAAVVAERENTLRGIAQTCAALTDVVAQLTPPHALGRRPTPADHDPAWPTELSDQ